VKLYLKNAFYIVQLFVLRDLGLLAKFRGISQGLAHGEESVVNVELLYVPGNTLEIDAQRLPV
jgi:hypothetical protein